MTERPRLTVGVLVLNLEDELLLLNSPKWKGKYIVPCGHVELMEKVEDALKREVREETGLKVYDLRFMTFLEFINPKQYHKKNLHFVGMQYVCRTKNKNVKINDEATSYLWAPPKKALRLNLEDGTRKSIECYLEKNWDELI